MRIFTLMVLLASFGGPAAAGDLGEVRTYEANDYSAQVYYRLDFGGARPGAQSLGLRFDSERAAAVGAPSLLAARFGAQGLDQLKLNGIDLRGAMLASNQGEGGGLWAGLSAGEWVIVGMAGIVFATAASGALDGSSGGTGGSGS